jgi:hypothetical protein
MTTSETAPRQLRPPTPHLDDVVAGLVNNGVAGAVARAAVREAARRGSRVRFVQVLPVGLTEEERADADRETFRVALRALRGQSRVPCSFEVLEGDPAKILVDRSRRASILVVGRDTPDSADHIAGYCQEHAECDVLTVADLAVADVE